MIQDVDPGDDSKFLDDAARAAEFSVEQGGGYEEAKKQMTLLDRLSHVSSLIPADVASNNKFRQMFEEINVHRLNLQVTLNETEVQAILSSLAVLVVLVDDPDYCKFVDALHERLDDARIMAIAEQITDEDMHRRAEWIELFEKQRISKLLGFETVEELESHIRSVIEEHLGDDEQGE